MGEGRGGEGERQGEAKGFPGVEWTGHWVTIHSKGLVFSHPYILPC